ncbi:hypothetical protein DIPPA_10919 [Diplonema papillatum]|nr:hypothetical protein DIPPA_10919 [Diplonema papillatum]
MGESPDDLNAPSADHHVKVHVQPVEGGEEEEYEASLAAEEEDFLEPEERTGWRSLVENPQFWPRLEYALRQGFAGGAAVALLATASVLAEFPFSVLVPILAVVGLQETVGLTFAAVYSVLQGYVIVLVVTLPFFLWIEQGDALYWVGSNAIILVLHTFTTAPSAKRLALALGIALMYTWWRGVNVPNDTGLQFGKTVLAGAAISIAASCFPFPRTGKARLLRSCDIASHVAVRALCALVLSVSEEEQAAGHLVNGQLHKHRLAGLLKKMKIDLVAAEWEESVSRFIASLLSILLICPLFGLKRALPRSSVLGAAKRDIAVLTRLASHIDAMLIHGDEAHRLRHSHAQFHRKHATAFRGVFRTVARACVRFMANDGLQVIRIDASVSEASPNCPDDVRAYFPPQSATGALYQAHLDLQDAISAWRKYLYEHEHPVAVTSQLKVFDYHVRLFTRELLLTRIQRLPVTPFVPPSSVSAPLTPDANPEYFDLRPVDPPVDAPFTPLHDTVVGPWLHVYGICKQLVTKDVLSTPVTAWVESAKMALCVTATTLICDELDLTPLIWGPITCVFLTSSTTSGSLTSAVNRVQGTVFGAMYGYTVLKSLPDVTPTLIVTFFAILCIFAGFVRSGTPKWSYAGVVSVITGTIILTSYEPVSGLNIYSGASYEVSELAFSRTQQTMLACSLYIVVVHLLFPVKPSALLRKEFLGFTAVFAATFEAVMATYKSLDQLMPDEEAHRLAGTLDGMLAGCDRQSVFLEETADEPAVLSPEVPAHAFLAVVKNEKVAATSLRQLLASVQQLAASSAEMKDFCRTLEPHRAAVHAEVLTLLALFPPSAFEQQAVVTATMRLRAKNDTFLDTVHQHILQVVRHLDAPVIGNEDAEAYNRFVQSHYSMVIAVCCVADALRAFRLEERSARLT